MKKENDEITDLFRTRLASGKNSHRRFLWLASNVVGYYSSV